MTYLITFLEGLITFISPCLLPMLPVYVAYFAGGRSGQEKRSPFWKALAFVLGFTVTFGVLGAFAGTIGGLLRRYQTEYRDGDSLYSPFWYCIRPGMDTLYWGISGLGADAGIFTGLLGTRNFAAFMLFGRSWNSFPHQCSADTEVKDYF